MYRLNLFLLIFAVTLISSCVPNPKNIRSAKSKSSVSAAEKGYSIVFYNLDNYAKIYIDDELVINTQELTTKTDTEVLVDLSEHINKNSKIIKVEGYNDDCNSCSFNPFEVIYEIFKDGEGIEYVSEDSNRKHAKDGLQTTQYHIIED